MDHEQLIDLFLMMIMMIFHSYVSLPEGTNSAAPVVLIQDMNMTWRYLNVSSLPKVDNASQKVEDLFARPTGHGTKALVQEPHHSSWFQSQYLWFNSHFPLEIHGIPWKSMEIRGNLLPSHVLLKNLDVSKPSTRHASLRHAPPAPQGLHSVGPSQRSVARSIWKARSAPWRSRTGGIKGVQNGAPGWWAKMVQNGLELYSYPLDPSGNDEHSYGKSPFLMGKFTLNGHFP